MLKFRVYALVLGEVLPEGNISDCKISKLTFAEQEERNFAPIQGVFSVQTLGNQTYATALPYVDPVCIKSEHVVVYDLEEEDAKGALGGAIRNIDRLCRILSIVYLQDIQQHSGREHVAFQPYVYQINKIYLIDGNSNETDPNFKLESGFVYLPDRPSMNDWNHTDTSDFLDQMLAIKDETLERALKYLYRSSVGNFILDSPEKVALDHVKSVEVILGALSNKKKFKERLAEAKQILELTDDEEKAITDLWTVRSEYGDIAHASKFDQAERYPNQFPLPSNSATHGLPANSFAANILLKYLRYRQRLFFIDIETADDMHADCSFASINPHAETNHLCYYTTERNKQQLKQKIKLALATHLSIDKADILSMVFGQQCRSIKISVK
ncbi:MAG TPA: hypothetical protein VNE40_02305 [Candidatus Dormibacteraeota bacterium]|nr:hypothetical protein [Candidatus Dormibacteraeota bacterium]